MPTETIIEKIKSAKEVYVLVSNLTNLLYIECEQQNYFDQVFLYEAKEDADKSAKDFAAKEIPVVVKELKTIEVSIATKEDEPEGERRKRSFNQVWNLINILPFLGVNAVSYQPVGAAAETVELSHILSEEIIKKLEESPLYQPTLQLTGAYLMQEARKKKELIDRKYLQELDEEFSANLVNSHLFVAVIPPTGQEKAERLDLRECKFPYLKNQNEEIFFPLFTDLWEFKKYAQGKQNLRSIQVPFKEIKNLWINDAKSYIVNPMGYSIPLLRKIIPELLKRFGEGDTATSSNT